MVTDGPTGGNLPGYSGKPWAHPTFREVPRCGPFWSAGRLEE